MNLSKKIVIACLALMLPLAVIALFTFFGKNQYKLQVFYAEDSVQIENTDQYKITRARVVPDFSLINQDGQPVTQQQYRGGIYVADFFFTRCEGICPKMTNQLARVQEAFLKDKEVKIVSFTIDPKYDSSKVLKAYAGKYRADLDKWNFVTGPANTIHQLAREGYGVVAPLSDTAGLDHSDKLILIDRQGWIRGYYNGTEPKDVDRLITEINILKEIYANDAAK